MYEVVWYGIVVGQGSVCLGLVGDSGLVRLGSAGSGLVWD